MSGEVFNDASMLEIFRAEVETHVESLTAGLLALERDPGDTSHIDEMMRGAHSIKGAARIVGIDPAVRIAHVMEDGFIAAQNGKLTLRPEHVDVLLRGVDLLSRLANASNDPTIDWTRFDAEATPLVAEISAVLAGGPVRAVAAKAVPQRAAPAVVAPNPTPNPAPNPAPNMEQGLESQLTIPMPVMLDALSADTVRRSFVAGLHAGATRIRLDLSATNDLDAIGLALLAAIPAQVRSGGPGVELWGASTEMQTVLQATGVDHLYAAEGQ